MNKGIKAALIGSLLAIGTVVAAFARRKNRAIVSPLQIRVDSMGNGNFGTGRSFPYHKHYGIDLRVVTGQKVYAPFSGTVSIIQNAIQGKPGYKGVRIFAEENLQIDVLYIIPAVKANTTVSKGDLIGYAQDIRKAYSSGMLNHIHVEHYDRNQGVFLNPTGYYFGNIKTASLSESFMKMSREEYANYVAHQFV